MQTSTFQLAAAAVVPEAGAIKARMVRLKLCLILLKIIRIGAFDNGTLQPLDTEIVGIW